MTAPKGVVLLIGGVNSATALAKSARFEPFSINFRYDQRHLVELESAIHPGIRAGALDDSKKATRAQSSATSSRRPRTWSISTMTNICENSAG